MQNKIFILLSVLFLSACGNKTETKSVDVTAVDSSIQDTLPHDVTTNEPAGILGIIDIPEILTLAIKDSALQDEIGFKMGKAYDAIESDMRELNLNTNDLPPGAIYYNNDPKNFVFECIKLINKMPTKQPKHSTVVVLEATRAVVYNYYGPYNKMSDAYTILNKYLTENKLVQTSAAREFYLSDATVEKDPSKWLSKIYIPVK